MPFPIQRHVDLNSDMGEGFGPYRVGDDEAMLDLVSSANVACGQHAGDPEIMAATFARARERGVAVGAHPGFADLWGFGRRLIPYSVGEIERLVAYQIGAAQALSRYAGHPVCYVKVHGALANLTETDLKVAQAVSRAIRAVDPTLGCLAIAHGHLDKVARDTGLATYSEIYADRGYDDDGHLVARALPGAVIHDPGEVAARAVRMIENGAIETLTGKTLPTRIDSICLHSDTPAAISIGRELRGRLEAAGIAIRSFALPVGQAATTP